MAKRNSEGSHDKGEAVLGCLDDADESAMACVVAEQLWTQKDVLEEVAVSEPGGCDEVEGECAGGFALDNIVFPPAPIIRRARESSERVKSLPEFRTM